ncbi:MAG: zinc metalloprotease HtpX [Bryobacterales bacterium]|nr:zinc metalloprotease HtpX [Bryobacterales bacterium]
MNRMKTYLLLAALTSLLLVAGQAMGGRGGLLLALAFAVVMNVGSYWFSDSIVLRMHNAQEIGPADSPEIYSMVQRLTRKANIPMPKLYIIPDDSPNAFATGRSPAKGAVAMTEGILRVLNMDELEGVIAHELAHIAHRDTLIMTVSATIAGALSSLGNMAMWGAMFGGGRSHDDEDGPHPAAMLASAIIAPFAAMLIQMAISRSREYMADEAAARYSGKPWALANALRKIEAWSHRIPMESGSPATAHMYISNPFSGGMASLFSTHPPTAERVARLEQMGRPA